MRLLIAARLSQARKGQTGIDTQDIDARAWAEANGHEIVGIAADKISGRVSPFKRPNLGPWLTDPKLMAQYDGVLGSKMDRLTRGRDWHTREWAETNGKKLVLATPSLIWPPEPGDIATPIIWDTLVNVASGEWENTSQRYRRMQASLKDSGFLVGRPMFGLNVIPVPGTEHSTLAPDPALVPYVKGMVERALNGDSLSSIGAWLESEGITPPDSEVWSPKSVSQILRNPCLIGRRTTDRGKGKTVLRFAPIIDAATFTKLQAKLDSNPKRRGAVSSDPAMLTGVIYCAKCKGVMHRRRSVTKRKDGSRYVYEGYRCDGTPRQPSTCRNMIPQADTDAKVNEWFTAGPVSNEQRIETIVIPGTGHQDELEQNARDIADLDIDAPSYDARLAELRAERKRLQSLPGEADRIEHRFTDQTVREFWLSLSTAERRAFLLDHGIRVFASREYWNLDTGEAASRFWWPAENEPADPEPRDDEHAAEEAHAANRQYRAQNTELATGEGEDDWTEYAALIERDDESWRMETS